MPKKVRPGSKRLPPWQTPQTQCRGSYSRKMSKKGVFEQAKDTFSLAQQPGTLQPAANQLSTHRASLVSPSGQAHPTPATVTPPHAREGPLTGSPLAGHSKTEAAPTLRLSALLRNKTSPPVKPLETSSKGKLHGDGLLH